MSDRPTPDDFRGKVFQDRAHIGDWRVEKLNDDGESYDVAIFSGAEARERAIRYADREYAAFDEIELEPYKRSTEDQIAAELSELWSALQAIREAVEELAPPVLCRMANILAPSRCARPRRLSAAFTPSRRGLPLRSLDPSRSPRASSQGGPASTGSRPIMALWITCGRVSGGLDGMLRQA